MAYQLYRTNISLTGNAKLCCYINSGSVTRASINPISNITAIIPHEINLHTDTYSYNISEFYKSYKGSFYTPEIDDKYTTDSKYKDIGINDEDQFFTGNIGDAQAGLKRVSKKKNTKQFSIFAPLYINSEDELPDTVQICAKREVTDSDGNKTIKGPIFKREITIKDGTLLGNYLSRSYKYMNGSYKEDDVTESVQEPRIMNVTPGSNGNGLGSSILRGWSIDSGGGMVNTSSNLPQKLFGQDLTHTEFDSYICHEFQAHNIVIPHIINFCWYFDLEDIIPTQSLNITYGDTLLLYVRYIKYNEDYTSTIIPCADLDFNHYNIPGKIKDGVQQNIIDYLHETQLPEIYSNQNEHLVPTISKWSLSASDDNYTFNAYLGYNELGSGYNVNTFTDEADSDADNISWINPVVTSTLNHQYALNAADESDYFNIERFIKGPAGSVGFSYIYSNIESIKFFSIIKNEETSCFCNSLLYKINPDYKGYIDHYDKISISYVVNKVRSEDDEKIIVIRDEDNKVFNIVFWIPEYVENIYDYSKCDTLTIKSALLGNGINIDYVYKIENTVWSNVGGELINKNIRDIFDLVIPSYIRINKRLYSTKTSENTYQLHQMQSESNDVISRYCGWIRPKFISVNGKSSENDYIFTKLTSWDDLDETYNNYGYLRIHDMKNDNNEGFDKYIYNDFFLEGKWFDASKCLYVPELIMYNESDKTKTVGECLVDAFKSAGIPERYVEGDKFTYLKNMYRYKIDISKDKTQYIIRLELK